MQQLKIHLFCSAFNWYIYIVRASCLDKAKSCEDVFIMTVWDILFCKCWQSLGNGALQVIFIIIINNLFMTLWCIILKVSAVIGDVKVSKGKEWIKHLSKICRVLVCLMTFYVRNTPLFKSETIRMVTNYLFSFLLDSIQCIHDNRKKSKN